MIGPRWVIGAAMLGWAAQTADAQIVQLPTIQVFTVGTTVMIPDRGSTYLGGVNRAAYGSSTVGVPGLSKIPGLGRLFTNRGFGSEISSSSVRASATIMNFDELDQEVLREAAEARGVGGSVAAGNNPETARRAAFISRNIARNTARNDGNSPPARSQSLRPNPQLPSTTNTPRRGN